MKVLRRTLLVLAGVLLIDGACRGQTPVRARQLPAEADPAFASYWGRWEGDDETGASVIMEAVGAGRNVIVFRTEGSLGPERRGFHLEPTDLPFQLGASAGLIYSKLPNGQDIATARLKSAAELEFEIRLSDHGRTSVWRFLLHKKAVQAPGR